MGRSEKPEIYYHGLIDLMFPILFCEVYNLWCHIYFIVTQVACKY